MNDQKILRDEIVGAVREEILLLKGEINGRLDGIDGRLGAVDGRLGRVDRRLDGIDGRLGGIDGRLDKIDIRFDDVDSRFDGVDEEFRRQGITLEEINDQLKAISEEQDILHRRIDRHDQHIARLETV